MNKKKKKESKDQKEIDLNIDLNTQIQWLSYSVIYKVTNLFICLAQENDYEMFI